MSEVLLKSIECSSPDDIKNENNILDLSEKMFEPHRMMILFALLKHRVLSFKEMKNVLNITDGNLASHLRSLEKENIIKSKKEFTISYKTTYYELTKYGRYQINELIRSLKMHLGY